MEKRVIFSDDATLVDFSVNANKYESGTDPMVFVSADDYLYIGSRQPFNSAFFKMGVANTNASTMSVSYWDGDNWVAMVDILDETVGLTADGNVTWYPDLDTSWHREHTNYNGETITGLSSVVIYNQYWVRIGFSADFSAGTTLRFVGNIFCDDDDIYSEFPDFRQTQVLTSFEAGKTDWEEQRVKASTMLVQDLISKKIIDGSGQILNRADYAEACVMKTAEVIFRTFGDDFVDQKMEARKEYNARLTKRVHRVDLNNNAIEDGKESKNETGFLNR